MRQTLVLLSKKLKLGSLGSKVKVGGAVGALEKKRLPVETDPQRLVNYVCGSNIYKTGEDVKLKDDSEYPEWLWKLKLDGPPRLEEMDPNTIEYWQTLHKLDIIRNLRLMKTRKLGEMRLNKEKKEIEKLKAIRFRALAAHHYDPGIDLPQSLPWK